MYDTQGELFMRITKRALSFLLTVMLAVSLLAVPSMAADWPQFLGEPDSQGVSDGQSPTRGSDVGLRWKRLTGTADENGEIVYTWCDVPGTPIVVGGYVYYYSSQYLRKIDLTTGEEVAAAQVYGEPVNQFFINIAYGEGKIFVPCQTNNMNDGTGVTGCFLRVFDAETLEQLYVTESIASGQPQSPVMYHDGYFVTGIYGSNAVYVGFTAEDEDPARTDEVKSISWSVDPDSKYGFSFNGAAFVGDYCYFGCDNSLFVVNYKSGEARSFDIGEGYSIHSTISYSGETKRLYVACNNPDGGASVFSYELESDGMPRASSARAWESGTANGGTQSTPVIYNGRLYIGGGGYTMGSNEPFHVIDAVTMEEIYSVPILTKGSAGISTAYAADENGQTVYIYLVPYAPNEQDHSELWIVTDSQGQTEAKYEIVDDIGYRQYCSQSVIVASDGSLIWYNDAAQIYCYENTAGIFADTKSHWAREDIAFLTRGGVINGIGNNLFAPDDTITRAQFTQILANMSGDDTSGYTADVFEDVKAGDWYAPAVAWAVENGVITGEGTFSPNEPICREDMSLMLYRYARSVARVELPAVNEAVSFTDQKEISDDAAAAVAAMQQAGIINGMPDGGGVRFAPQDQAARAQAAAMIARFFRALSEQN